MNETQFHRLFEVSDAKAPDFNGGDVKEYPGATVSTTANVSTLDGEETYGKQPTTDKISKQLSNQNFWSSQLKGSRMP